MYFDERDSSRTISEFFKKINDRKIDTQLALNPGTDLLRRFVRNKGDPLCDEFDLIKANRVLRKLGYPMVWNRLFLQKT